MKKFILSFVVLLASSLFAAGQSDSSGSVTLTMTSGAVRIKSSDQAKWVKAVVNSQLSASTVIQTGDKSRARVRFQDDGSEMIIPEGKTVTVANLLKKRGELRQDGQKMRLNRLKARLSREANPGEAAPTAVAGVRGANVSKADSKATPPKEPEELIWEE